LFHLALVSLCWFVHCCVWGNFKAIAILLNYRDKNIPMLHVIIVDHRAWRKGPSYFGFKWRGSSPKLLLPCLWWCELGRWWYYFLFISWPFWSSFALLQPCGWLEGGIILGVMHVMLVPYTPLVSKVCGII